MGRSWVSVGRSATPGISPPSGDSRAGPGVEVDAPRCRRALERSRRKGAHALDPGNWYSPEDADGDPDACVDAVCSRTLSRLATGAKWAGGTPLAACAIAQSEARVMACAHDQHWSSFGARADVAYGDPITAHQAFGVGRGRRCAGSLETIYIGSSSPLHTSHSALLTAKTRHRQLRDSLGARLALAGSPGPKPRWSPDRCRLPCLRELGGATRAGGDARLERIVGQGVDVASALPAVRTSARCAGSGTCTSGLAAALGASFCHGGAGRERRSTPYAWSLSQQPRGVSLRRSRRMCGAVLSACRALTAMERASTTSWPGPVTPWCSSAVSASTLAGTGRSSTRSPAATACSLPTTAALAEARSPTHRTATR